MPNIAPQTNTGMTDIDLVLCRAILYAALALGFRSPTAETLKRLTVADGNRALRDAAAPLEGAEKTDLRAAVDGLGVNERSLATLSAQFARLFGHTAHGVVSPYETEYGAEALFQQAHDLGDLSGFYTAFGLTLNPTEHERADHISCECEFLAFLAAKEAYAIEQQEPAMLAEVRKATRLFLRDHLARFLPAFARKLAAADSAGFYATLADLGLRFVAQECSRLDVPLGLATLELRPAVDDRVPMACGNGRECIAMAGAFDPEEPDDR